MKKTELRLFILIFLAFFLPPNKGEAFVLYSWKRDNSKPIPYYINLGAYATAANRNDLIQGIRNAFKHVQDNPFINVTFNYLGETTTLPAMDDVSVVYLDSDRTYVPGSGITLNIKTLGNISTSADIALNGPQYVGSPYVNLYAVTLHELCHLLGLGHSVTGKDSAVYANTVNLQLSPDDVAGLATLYPEPTRQLSASCGTVRGKITNASGVGLRARIVAYNASKPQPRIVTVNANTDGTYELPGIPPGTYNFFAETYITPFVHAFTINGVGQVVAAGSVLQNRNIDPVLPGHPRLDGRNTAGVAVVHPLDGNIYIALHYGGFIRVVTPSTGEWITTLLGINVDDMAFTQDGKRLIAVSQTDRELLVIDTEPESPTKHTVISRMSNILPQSVGVAVKGNSMAYVCCNSGRAVLAVDLTSMTVIATIMTNEYNQDIYLSPDGLRAYFGSYYDGQVKWNEIDTNPASPTYHTIVRRSSAGDNGAYDVKPSATGDRVFIGTKDGLDVRRRSDNALLGQIEGRQGSFHPFALTRDGKHIGMLDHDSAELRNNQLLVVDTNTLSVVETIMIGGDVDYVQLGGRSGQLLVTGRSGLFDVRPTILAPDALSALTVSGLAFSPAFSRAKLSYSIPVVPHTTSSIRIKPTVAYAGATIEINGVTATSGVLSANIPLNHGPNTINVKVTAADGLSSRTYTIAVERAQPPEIVVEHGAAVDVPDGGSLDFGLLAVGTNRSITLTVKNTGPGLLSGIKITKSGTSAGSFAITSNPASTVNPGGTTTFTLKFAPTSIGTKTALIRLANNDADENPFDITVTGEAGLAGTLSFDPATVLIDEGTGTASVFVKRINGSIGNVTATVSTANGTAVAPGDYTPFSGQVITFGNGDTTPRQVSVTISPPAGGEVDEIFTVKLASPTGGAVLGAQKTATVKILSSVDSTRPAAPVITTPALNAKLGINPGGMVAITGTASDNQYVADVEVSLDGGLSYSLAGVTRTGTGSRHGTTASFAIQLPPVTGSNTIHARTVDKKGNRSDPVAKRTFIVLRSLQVTADPLRGSVTKGYSPASFREVGKQYTVTATPKSGQFFAGWTANDFAGTGVTDDTRHMTSLTFTMVEGLQLTANFIANPFPALAGGYNGLIAPTGMTLPGTNANGFVTVTVASAGTFSGKVTLDGSVMPFSGAFDSAGIGRFGTTKNPSLSLIRKNRPIMDLSLRLDMTAGKSISGVITVRDSAAVLASSAFVADRAVFGIGGRLVDPAYTPVGSGTTAKGSYTVVFRNVSQALALDGFTTLTPAEYPEGHGHAVLTLTAKGAVSLSGILADGTAVSASAPLSENLDWPLFKQIYSGKGCIGGMVKFDRLQSDSDLSQAGCYWFRPAISGQQYYPGGWPSGIKVHLLGSLYQATSNNSVLPTLGASDADGNADLQMDGGLLGGPLAKTVFIAPNDAVTNVPADSSFKLNITRRTGIFSGTLPHPNGTKPPFKGVILQKGANVGGWGWFLTTKPKKVDGSGQAGSVKLIPQLLSVFSRN